MSKAWEANTGMEAPELSTDGIVLVRGGIMDVRRMNRRRRRALPCVLASGARGEQ